MKSVTLSTTPAIIAEVTGPLSIQAEGGDIRICYDGSGSANLGPRKGTRLEAGQLITVQAQGPVWAVSMEAAGATVHVQEAGAVVASPALPGPLPEAAPLVLVSPRIGSTGTIALPDFTAGQIPLSTPTVGPEFHGCPTLTLHAPSGNTDPIYYGFTPDVRPGGDTTNHLGANLVTNGDFAADDDVWTMGSWTIGTDLLVNRAVLELTSIVVLTSTYPLVPNSNASRPAGYYVASAVVESTNSTNGETRVELLLNDVVVGSSTGGTITYSFYHPGGPLNVKVLAVCSREADSGSESDYSAVVDSVSLKRTINATANTGTPLLPGQTADLSRVDYPRIDRVYIVPSLAETDAVVIANYAPPA